MDKFRAAIIENERDRESPQWKGIAAWSHQYAAEQMAEEFDADGNYNILNYGPATIIVEPARGGARLEYVVHGEAVPQYSARFVGSSDGSE